MIQLTFRNTGKKKSSRCEKNRYLLELLQTMNASNNRSNNIILLHTLIITYF